MKRKSPTFEQKQFLLRIYKSKGFAAVTPSMIKYGFSPKSIFKWASDAGFVGTRGRRPGEWKGRTGKTDGDLRWAKAIEIGAIEA